MNIFKWGTACALAALAAPAALGRTGVGGLPAVTKVINGRAAMVLVVRSLTGAADSFNKLAGEVSANWTPQSSRAIFAQMGSTKGINYAGSAAVVFLRFPTPAQMQPMAGPPVAMVIPVTNAQTFLAPLNPTPAKGGVMTVRLGGAPMNSYVAQVGKFVVLSSDARVARALAHVKKSLATTMAPALQKRCTGKAAFLYVRGTAIAKPMITDILYGRTQSRMMQAQMQGMQANGAGKPNPAKPKARIHYSRQAALHLMLASVRTGLASVRQMVITADAARGGLQLHAAMLLQRGSALAGVLSGAKPLNNKPLAGLPMGTYLGAGAFTMNGAAVGREIAAVNAAMVKRHQPWAKSRFETVKLKRLLARLALLGNQRAVIATSSAHGGAHYGIVISGSPHPNKLIRLPVGNGYRTLPGKISAGGASFTRLAHTRQTSHAGGPQHKGKKRPTGATYCAVVHHHMLLIMNGRPAQLGPIAKRVRSGSNALGRRIKIYAAGEKPLPHPWFLAYLAMDRWAAGLGAAAPSNALAVGAPPAPVLISANHTAAQVRINVDVPAAQVKDFLQLMAPAGDIVFGL